ncbi:MAG: photosynthetic reaction center cytochrome c subunit family protein [Terracidiphilus sp.]
MKLTSLLSSALLLSRASLLSPVAAVALLTAAVLASTTGVQATQDQPQAIAQTAPAPPAGGAPPQNTTSGMASGGRPMRNFPAPTNLQVLPKDLTGQQVHEIMEGFANGKPRLNFADDSKDDKKIARIMLTMTQQINADYISKASAMDPDAMGMKVTCGTCHRGHEMPEEFVIPKEGGPGGPPAGGPPAGAPPPAAAPRPTN